MTAPLASLTVPVIDARSDWARTVPVVKNNTEKTMSPNFMSTPTPLTKWKGGSNTPKRRLSNLR